MRPHLNGKTRLNMKINKAQKGLFVSLALLFTLSSNVVLCAFKSTQKVVYADNVNLVSDGDFSCFNVGGTDDQTLPSFPDFDHQLTTLNNENNSHGIVRYNNGDPYLDLRYDGVSSGTNTNIWMFFSNIAQGEGTYTIEYDLYANGLSTGDWIGWQLLGVEPSLDLDGCNVYNSGDYFALANSTAKSGWKHVSFNVTQNESQGRNNDTFVINFYNKQDASMYCLVDNVSIKKNNTELFKMNGLYVGDFSYYFESEVSLTVPEQHGYGTLDGLSPAKIIRDGSNIACKLSYTQGLDKICFLYKFVTFPGPGRYKVEFDIKFPNTANAYDFGMRFAGPELDGNTDVVLFLMGKDELNDLYDSTALGGYKHLTSEMFIDSYQYTNVDSIQIFYGTMGNVNDYVIIDNLSITLDKASLVKQASHISEVHTDLIGNGDFENYPAGTIFSQATLDQTDNWSTIGLDSPAQVIEENGNHLLKLQYDGLPSHHFASCYVSIHNSLFDVKSSYKLSFDYKQDFVSNNTIGHKWHVSFLGTLAHETYKCYLNNTESLHYLEAPNNVTNGVNEDIYSFTVTNLENGWSHFEMTFDINYTFMKDVDNMRFVFDSEQNVDNVVYLDNVSLDIYKTMDDPFVPIVPDDPTSSSFNPLIVILSVVGGVLVVGAIVTIVLIKKRKVAK